MIVKYCAIMLDFDKGWMRETLPPSGLVWQGGRQCRKRGRQPIQSLRQIERELNKVSYDKAILGSRC